MKEIKLDKQYTRFAYCIPESEYDKELEKTATLFEHLSDFIKSGYTREMKSDDVDFIIDVLAQRVTTIENEHGIIRFLSQDGDWLIELTPAEE